MRIMRNYLLYNFYNLCNATCTMKAFILLYRLDDFHLTLILGYKALNTYKFIIYNKVLQVYSTFLLYINEWYRICI